MLELTKEQLRNFKRTFDLFDEDGNGQINKQEIITVFKELKIRLSESEIDRIISQFDEDGNQCIQFDEFIAVLGNNIDVGQSEAWLYEVFEIIDQDCDGIISKEELTNVIKLYNLGIDEKEVDLILESCDHHGENGINYEEFSTLLRFK